MLMGQSIFEIYRREKTSDSTPGSSNGHQFVLHKDKSVGFCACYTPHASSSSKKNPNVDSASTGILTYIAISPQYQLQGLGTILLKHSIHYLRETIKVK